MSPVVFASVYPSIRSTDIKLQEVQRNMTKMTVFLLSFFLSFSVFEKINGEIEDHSIYS